MGNTNGKNNQKPKEPMEARGRNGWFKPVEARLSRYADRLSVGIVSNRSGQNDPIYLTGSVADVATFLEKLAAEARKLADATDGFADIRIGD